ncbi:MAG: hypothetical protein M3R13_11840 [Armatimonadota bacterium]|nr:hypothetical protein [Armatimonadota bacterium]
MKYLLSSILAILATAALATDVIWQADAGPHHPQIPMDGTSHVVATPDGGAFAAYIASHTLKGDTYYSTGVVKFSSTGTVQWRDYFESARGAVLGLDSFGNIYATIFPAAIDHWSEFSPRTRKYAPDGTLLWEYSQGWGRSSLDMIVEPNGTWYLADFNWNGSTASVQKISASGTLIWEREALTNELSITRDHSGDIVVLDGSTLTVLDENGNTLRTLSIPGWLLRKERTAFGPENEVYLANPLRSYDSLGNLRWERTFPDVVETVACDGYIVFVTTRTSALWLDRSGNTLKQVALQGVPFGPSSLDGLGNLWVMHYTLLYRLRQNPG